MIRKCLAVGIILLFIGTAIIPSVPSEQMQRKDIITVNDNGGGDYTSIKEAVNHSNPGDTIEVYSGTFNEEWITIDKENITLRGISHDLGGGNDTGKPFIKGIGTILWVKASNVTVTNFRIENWDESGTFTFCIWIGDVIGKRSQRDDTISYCNLTHSYRAGIYCQEVGKNITIVNNNISNVSHDAGIALIGVTSFIVKGNVLTDDGTGIHVDEDHHEVAYNIIKRCGTGIYVRNSYNRIYRNEIENCSVGVYLYDGNGNIVTENNFKNYSKTGFWWEWFFGYYPKNKWQSNYWNSWKGIGPKRIPGVLVLWIFLFIDTLTLPIPWVEFDWHPAQQPYNISGMS